MNYPLCAWGCGDIMIFFFLSLHCHMIRQHVAGRSRLAALLSGKPFEATLPTSATTNSMYVLTAREVVDDSRMKSCIAFAFADFLVL